MKKQIGFYMYFGSLFLLLLVFWIRQSLNINIFNGGFATLALIWLLSNVFFSFPAKLKDKRRL